MRTIIALSLLLSLPIAYADGLLPPKEPQAITVSMPDGTKKAGIIKDGVFVPMVEPVAMSAVAQPTVIQAGLKAGISEDDAVSMIAVESMMLPLNSKLKKRYAAYRVSVTSSYPNKLRMVSGSVGNAVDGTTAYRTAKGTTAKSLFGFLAPDFGILTVPISAAVIHSRNKKAETEGLQYPGQVPAVEALRKGEGFQFTVLVPAGQKPQVRVAFKDQESGLEFTKYAQ